jgi:hypothetical protein
LDGGQKLYISELSEGAVEQSNPKKIQPLNDTESGKVDKLADSMKERGWLGDPLLTVESNDLEMALTGSHRVQAAKKAGLEEVPVVKLSSKKVEKWCKDHDSTIDDFMSGGDEDRLERVKEIGDKDAIELIESEIYRNNL